MAIKFPKNIYLFRAIYDWIVDNEMTPYVLLNTSINGVVVPQNLVNDNKIVLNISPIATSKYIMNENGVEFDAKFSDVIFHISFPYLAALALYAKENGDGIVFNHQDEVLPSPKNRFKKIK